MVLRIISKDDEHIEFMLNEHHIISVNHDSHGWAGMKEIEELLKRVAEIASWNVQEEC